MRKETITYDACCQVLQEMKIKGEQISVRALLSHTGGSFSKIARFLKAWQLEQAHASSAPVELSNTLKQSILAEIGKAVTETSCSLKEQLQETNKQLDESHETLTKQENHILEQTELNNELKQKLAVMEKINEQQRERIKTLEDNLEKSRQAHHESDKKAAVAETKYLELEKRFATKQA